jgi:DNA-binding FadR family transcriptional regulator
VTVYRRPDPIPLRHTTVASAGGLAAVKHEPDDLNRLVAREIFQAIASGHFPVGSILPNEHQLSAELGVSRTALREAIKGLASKGLVETRRKRGTLVLDRSRWDMLNAEVIAWSRKLGSARVSEELWAAIASTQPAMAAEAAGRRHAGRVAGAVRSLAAAGTPEARRTGLAALLLEIANASGNRFLTSFTSACVGSLLADDAAFLDRLVATIDMAALGRLAPLLTAGNGEAAADLLRRTLVRETVSA